MEISFDTMIIYTVRGHSRPVVRCFYDVVCMQDWVASHNRGNSIVEDWIVHPRILFNKPYLGFIDD